MEESNLEQKTQKDEQDMQEPPSKLLETSDNKSILTNTKNAKQSDSMILKEERDISDLKCSPQDQTVQLGTESIMTQDNCKEYMGQSSHAVKDIVTNCDVSHNHDNHDDRPLLEPTTPINERSIDVCSQPQNADETKSSVKDGETALGERNETCIKGEVDTEQTGRMLYRTGEALSEDSSTDSSSDGSSDEDTTSGSSDDERSSSDNNSDEAIEKGSSQRKTSQVEAADFLPDEDGEKTSDCPPKTKGELSVEDLPPIEELAINLDDSVIMEEVGHIASVVGLLVIVQANRELPALNDNSVLFVDERKVLGQIFEVFGPVPSPLYSVRFNSTQDITERDLKPGKLVYYAPRESWLTNYVFVEQLRRLKGSDASWEHNNEPPAKFLDYSDDEEERRAKAKLRGKDVGAKPGEEQAQPGKKRKPVRQRNRNDANANGPNHRDWDNPERMGGPFNQPPFNQNPFRHMHQGPRHPTQDQQRFPRPRGPGMNQMREFPPRGFGPAGPRFGEVPQGYWGRGPGFRQFRPGCGPNPRIPFPGVRPPHFSAHGGPPYFHSGPQDQTCNPSEAFAYGYMNDGMSSMSGPPSNIAMPPGAPFGAGQWQRFNSNANFSATSFNSSDQNHHSDSRKPNPNLVDSRFMQNEPGNSN